MFSLGLTPDPTGEETSGGRGESRDIRTNGRATTASSPRPPAQNHRAAVAGNRDASLSFSSDRYPTPPLPPAGARTPDPAVKCVTRRRLSLRGRPTAAPRGPVDPSSLPGNVGRPLAPTGAAPPPRRHRRSRPDRDRSSCRSAPEPDNACRGITGPKLRLLQARPYMDGVRSLCYKAPASVLDTV